MGLLANDEKHAYIPKVGAHIFVPRSSERDLKKCINFEDRIAAPHFALTSLIGYIFYLKLYLEYSHS